MEASHILSQEQRHVLGTVFHLIESSLIYFRSVLPVVREADEQMVRGQIELGEVCLKNLARYFPELRPLAEEWKKRGGL